MDRLSIAVLWAIVAGVLVLLMQGGFAMVAAGLSRAKNAAHTISMGLMICPAVCLAFWGYGFALGWGNLAAPAASDGWAASLGPGLSVLDRGVAIGSTSETSGQAAAGYGLLGLKGFCLHGLDDPAVLALFFLMLTFMVTAASIPTGTMVERWSWRSFFLYGLWMPLPLALYANWVWGGGWLAQAGTHWRLGHGVVDVAGSGVIHAMGGVVALAGTLVLGPRLGKYRERRPLPIPGHHVPMVVVGTFLLATGWFGLIGGSALSGSDLRPSLMVVEAVLAGAAGTLAAVATLRLKGMKPDPTLMCNGLVAGLVAISAGCGLVDTWAAVLIGAIGGVIAVLGVFACEKRGVDDPVGAISVHGAGGLWGLVAVGLFASGRFGAGCHGVVRADVLAGAAKGLGYDGVRGLFYGDPSQLVAQLAAAAVLLIFGLATASACFKLSNLLTPMRVVRDTELMGLDAPEMGALGYPDFTVTSRP
jgi:Amt family ammonium transporter